MQYHHQMNLYGQPQGGGYQGYALNGGGPTLD